MNGWALLVGWLLATPGPLPTAPPAPLPPTVDAPAAGTFLVANHQVYGLFAETVIVLLDHDAGGSLGLIVNRPVELTLEELLPGFEEARGREERAWLGGPVEPDKVLLLVRSPQAPGESSPVLDGVHVSGHRDTLRKLLTEPAKGVTFRAYVGYAGWAPGQLASELGRGDWTLAPGDADSVFTTEPDALWRKLLERHRQIEVRWSGPLAGRPKSINLSPPWRSVAESSVSRTSGRAPSSTR
jgi:putative transcriptional regulator